MGILASSFLGGSDGWPFLGASPIMPDVIIDRAGYDSTYSGFVRKALGDDSPAVNKHYANRDLYHGIGTNLGYTGTHVAASGATVVFPYSTEPNIPATIKVSDFASIPSGSDHIGNIHILWSPVISKYIGIIYFTNGTLMTYHWVVTLDPAVSGGNPSIIGSKDYGSGTALTALYPVSDGARFVPVDGAQPLAVTDANANSIFTIPAPYFGYPKESGSQMVALGFGASDLYFGVAVTTMAIKPSSTEYYLASMIFLAAQAKLSSSPKVRRSILASGSGAPFNLPVGSALRGFAVGDGLAVVDIDGNIQFFNGVLA